MILKWLEYKLPWLTKDKHYQQMVQLSQKYQGIIQAKEIYYEGLHEETKNLYYKDLFEKINEIQSQLDPLIKELTEFIIHQEKIEWSITLKLAPDLVMKLRDPTLTSHFDLKNVIIKRLLNLIENQLKNGLAETTNWK